MVVKESHKIMQELEKKAYKEKSYYYNLEKSITSGTPMLVISEDFTPTLRDQDLLNNKEKDSVNKDKVEAKEFAKQGEKI